MERKTEQLATAREHEENANKKMKGSCFVNLFTNKADRMDAARQLFEKSANSYKLAEDWKKAGEMYEKWAECDQHTYGSPTM